MALVIGRARPGHRISVVWQLTKECGGCRSALMPSSRRSSVAPWHLPMSRPEAEVAIRPPAIDCYGIKRTDVVRRARSAEAKALTLLPAQELLEKGFALSPVECGYASLAHLGRCLARQWRSYRWDRFR